MVCCRGFSRLFAFLLIAVFVPLCRGAQNPIQIENANAGTPGWQLSNPATNREIEGYASLTSVNIGGTIKFFVSTRDSTFKLDIYRTGWYGGTGARLLRTVSSIAGGIQPDPAPDPTTGLVECNWASSYTLSVPTTWVSGIFLARLTGNQSGKQSYIIFAVRDDARASALLFELSVTTYEAYNFWPNGQNGKSLYNWAPGGRAWKVSFNRPYVLGASYTSTSTGAAAGVGAGEYLTNLQPGPDTGYPILPAGFEYNMVRWLEENGYDVTYFTGVDLSENASLLTNHKALLSVGHNEYWSMQMRTNVQNALANGLNLGVFSSNTLYWQVRFEQASDGTADRTMVCYKYDAASFDPDYNTSPRLSTVEWRQSPVNMPESALLGSEYIGDPAETDIVISNASHWLMNGSGLSNGDHLTGILGYEIDAMVPGTSPANTQILATSPVGPFNPDVDNPPGFSCGTQVCNSNVTWYAAGRAFVFATGSMQWSWGLDDYNAPALRPVFSSAAVQQITQNVLASFINPVTVATTSLAPGTVGTPYPSVQLAATGGGQPYTWTASGLPSGMNLSSGGVLSGTPGQAGTFSVVFTVKDAAQNTGTATLPFVVNSSTTTYTISGNITLSGNALSGVTVSMNTGATTTTNSSGNYSFAGLASGTYTVTPSLAGYVFSPSSKTFTNITANQTANFTASAVTTTANAVSINFVGNGTAMATGATGETAGVIPKPNWNNATGNTSSPISLVDETGAFNGATVSYTGDNPWAVPIADNPGNFRMVRGYLDTGNQDPSTITVAGLPTSARGYDIYVYVDGDNASSTVTATYKITGTGVTTTSITATDAANTNFNGTFVQANNSVGNYVKFTGVQATGFTLTAIPTSASDNVLRAPVDGIQIVPSPPTYTISGQITASGNALSGVTVSLNTGATTTTNGSGNYSFTGLVTGTYTVTPSLVGYTFTPPNQTFTNITANQTANFTGSAGTITSKAVSINFVGNGTAMAATETAGVVPKTHWNNAPGNTSGGMSLVDETGASNGATVSYTGDNPWVVPITDTPGNFRMVRGYLDTGNQDPSTITVTGLPPSSSGYDVYVYVDGDNASSTVTAGYKISGTGITTTTITATDAANSNFNGTFVQANNSAGNYVKFTAIQATGFTLTAIPTSASDGALRAPVDGIEIVPSAPTYTISGQITASGTALSGVTVSLNTGATTTTNSSGSYSFTGLVTGTYTVTPSRTGYTFTPPNQSFTSITSNQTANFTASAVTNPVNTVSINFVGGSTAMAASESAGVVAKTNWNNASGNSGGPLSLVDSTGTANGAKVSWTSDNTWSTPITNSPGNARMMNGYLDTGAGNPSTVSISGLPTSSTGYDIYVYFDGDNASAKKVAGYTISGSGITTATISGTDAANTNFSGSFVQANSSAGNYVKFTSITATAFSITATPTSASNGSLRAPVNGIQVVPH